MLNRAKNQPHLELIKFGATGGLSNQRAPSNTRGEGGLIIPGEGGGGRVVKNLDLKTP